MSAHPPPTVDQCRAIRRDYREKDERGRWRYSLEQVAQRNRVSVGTVSKVCKTWGLSRYMTRGAA